MVQYRSLDRNYFLCRKIGSGGPEARQCSTADVPGKIRAIAEANDVDQLRARREEIIALVRRRGAQNVRVFGSIARGDQNPASDVDFLVDFETGRSLLDLTALWLELETALGCKVEVVSSRGLRPRVASEVMRDAVPL